MELTRREVAGNMLAAAAVADWSRSAKATTAALAIAGQALRVRTSDGLMLSAMAYGDAAAPEILFVHGLGQCRLSWNRQIGASMTNRFRLVTYDLRGHGDSDQPRLPSSYSDAALWGDDLHAVISQAGLRRPIVVAWSMGGLITGHYLTRYGAGGIAGVNLVD